MGVPFAKQAGSNSLDRCGRPAVQCAGRFVSQQSNEAHNCATVPPVGLRLRGDHLQVKSFTCSSLSPNAQGAIRPGVGVGPTVSEFFRKFASGRGAGPPDPRRTPTSGSSNDRERWWPFSSAGVNGSRSSRFRLAKRPGRHWIGNWLRFCATVGRSAKATISSSVGGWFVSQKSDEAQSCATVLLWALSKRWSFVS